MPFITEVAGQQALHCHITQKCMATHENDGLGAFDEAAKRCREMYAVCLRGWRAKGMVPQFHLVLTVDRDAAVELEPM